MFFVKCNLYTQNKKSNNKGLTLIEVMISLALLGMILTSIFSLHLFGIKTFARSEVQSYIQYETRMAADFIIKNIRYAKTIEILNAPPSPEAGYNDIYIDNGQIKFYYSGIPTQIIGTGDANDFTLEFIKASNRVLNFQVGKTTGNQYDVESQITILNIGTIAPYGIQDVTTGNRIGIRYTLDLSDQQAVDIDLTWLYILNPDFIIGDINLPTIGPNETIISWESSYSDYVGEDGSVTRPSGSTDISVTLTATVQRGEVSQTKVFELMVRGVDSVYIVRIDDLVDTVIKGSNYTLPATIRAYMSDGTQDYRSVTWYPASISTNEIGIKTITGTVSEYNSSIMLTVYIVEGIDNLIPFNDLIIGDYIRIRGVDDFTYDFQKIGVDRVLIKWRDNMNDSEEIMKNWDAAQTDGAAFCNKFSSSIVIESGLLTKTQADGLDQSLILVNNYKWWLSTHQNNINGHFVRSNGSIHQEGKTNLNQVRPYIDLKPDMYVSGGEGTVSNPYILYQ